MDWVVALKLSFNALELLVDMAFRHIVSQVVTNKAIVELPFSEMQGRRLVDARGLAKSQDAAFKMVMLML